MPWRDFAEDWLGALSRSYQASFLGVEKKNGMAVFELDRRIPTERDLKLTFPCGQGLSGRPVWQRTPLDKDKTTLVGFCTHELGLTTLDLTQFQQAEAVRTCPRLPVRVWAKFLPLRPNGTVTEDLSLGGCRLKGEHDSLLGQTVALELDLVSQNEPVTLQARVLWSRNGSTGVKFINLSVFEEELILKAIGEVVAQPSDFLPDQSVTTPNCYAIAQDGPYTLLHLAVPNWDFKFQLAHTTVKGESVGCFEKFYALESSDELTELRAKLKIGLDQTKSFIHLYLVNEEDEVVLDLAGEELFHDRTRRTPLKYGNS